MQVFYTAEEIRRLHDERGHFAIERVKTFWQSRASLSAIDRVLKLYARVLHVGIDYFKIFRMNRAGDDNLVAARDALGHEHGFCKSGRAVVHGSVGYFHPGYLAD